MSATTGAVLIAAERERQITGEGWTAEHDDSHEAGELALAACCYAMPVQLFRRDERPLAHAMVVFHDPWPWDDNWDKRKGGGNKPRLARSVEERIDWLVKAGALLAAEIDRLQRVSDVPR